MADNEEEDELPTAPFWMATFSDMVTLLLAFFVMIVAMSEVEVQKFRDALSYFSGSTGPMHQAAINPTMKPPTESSYLTPRMIEQYERIVEYIRRNELQHAVQAELTTQGVRVTITDSLMFPSGEAVLLEPSRRLLDALSGLLAEGVGEVHVEGHTDDVPIQTARFPSNWELSGARAASVVRHLLEHQDALPPRSYTAVGHGEHRPVAPNETAGGRARNRRVEMLFAWERSPSPPPPSPSRRA